MVGNAKALVDIKSHFPKNNKVYAIRGKVYSILKDRGDGSYLIKGEKENFIAQKNQIQIL